MTELSDFMEGCQSRDPMTLHDHLTEAGYTEDFLKRKSIEAQAVRAILNYPHYKALRGTVIFPSPDTRAGWAKGIKVMEDRHVRPRFSTSLVLTSTVGDVIAKNDFHYKGAGGTELALVAAQRAIATASRTKQEAIGNAVVGQSHELDWVKRELEMSISRCHELEADLAVAKQQNVTLITALTKQLGEKGNMIIPVNGGSK